MRATNQPTTRWKPVIERAANETLQEKIEI
jgi:hypothetical protein